MMMMILMKMTMTCFIPSDKRIACDEEFSESEDEGDPSSSGTRRDRSHRRKKARTEAAGETFHLAS